MYPFSNLPNHFFTLPYLLHYLLHLPTIIINLLTMYNAHDNMHYTLTWVSFFTGSSGRFGILDKDNVFLLGVDAKSNLSQLVALKMDMSLLTRGLELSVVPYFDISEQPSTEIEYVFTLNRKSSVQM